MPNRGKKKAAGGKKKGSKEKGAGAETSPENIELSRVNGLRTEILELMDACDKEERDHNEFSQQRVSIFLHTEY